jgi:hypothetical protein
MNSLHKYIAAYKNGGDFRFTHREVTEKCGIRITIDFRESSESYSNPESGMPQPCGARQTAQVLMEKGDLCCRYECVEIQCCHDTFFPVTLLGKHYLLVRKTLYGFTLVDTETLCETYNYFPSAVLEGQESYIIADAHSFEDLLIFDGCYWACPYVYFLCDPVRNRFADLSAAYGLLASDNGIQPHDGQLTLIGEDNEGEIKSVTVTGQELRILLRDSGMDSI